MDKKQNPIRERVQEDFLRSMCVNNYRKNSLSEVMKEHIWVSGWEKQTQLLKKDLDVLKKEKQNE